MLDVPVYNIDGKQVDTLQVDEAIFGGEVNASLVKQAVVTYHANKRQGTVYTRGRSRVEGSTRKLFRQKGTGGARRGNIRTNIMKGGGVAFGKTPHSYRKKLPQKMRKAALNSALLAKMIGGDLMVLDQLSIDAPKTKTLANVLANLGINRSCLMAIDARNPNIYLSSRNLEDLTVRVAAELNAFDVVTRQKMIVTRPAMDLLMGQEVNA